MRPGDLVVTRDLDNSEPTSYTRDTRLDFQIYLSILDLENYELGKGVDIEAGMYKSIPHGQLLLSVLENVLEDVLIVKYLCRLHAQIQPKSTPAGSNSSIDLYLV